MNGFSFYFTEGWRHIISLDALDHQLFILAITAPFLLRDWRSVLILVTAFTLGHSVTLALSVYDVLRINTAWVEFLIPCTIVICAGANFNWKTPEGKNFYTHYLLAFVFGLIHGLGFANTLRFLLAKGDSLGWNLFGFNLGLEAGQIVVVLAILLLAGLAVQICKLNRRYWVIGLSILCIILAGKFAMERLPG